ncbi:hypothetical protein [Hymenobacter sp. DG01]|uniref:hypothetical protein n=1 Tax=Hymenobacter sp. DG01 TaxID=2584940 RepID=UPI00111E823B|nr:hypothetical protein [Hymenobacter sp. DG01]
MLPHRLAGFLCCALLVTACTLTPHSHRGRMLNPDRELAAPAFVPADSTAVPADSLAPRP